MKQLSVHSQTLPATSLRPLLLVPNVPMGCGTDSFGLERADSAS
jgi:hypothetical protein